MGPFAVLTGNEVAIAIAILVFFLISIVISLSVRKSGDDEGDLEHFDHEHGEADAR
jgi:hypothetical protein